MVETTTKIPLPEGHDWNYSFEDYEDDCEKQYLVIHIFPEGKTKPAE